MKLTAKHKKRSWKMMAVVVYAACCLCTVPVFSQEPADTSASSSEAEVLEDVEDRPEKMPEIAVLRTVPDSTVSKMQREKAFAYANDPAYWKKEPRVYKKRFWDYIFEFFASDAVRWIFYILLATVIIFVLYRIIVVNDLLLFYSSKRKKLADGEQNAGEIDPTLIDQKIAQAIEGKEYNAAVRFLYLKMLYSLNERNAIHYHAEGTNNEYLNQMSQHKLSQQFRFLTQVYEYVWYGKFDITEIQFSSVHNHFKNFHSGI